MGAENLGYLAQLLGGMQQGKLMKQKRELTAAQLKARQAEAEQKAADRLATSTYRGNQLDLQQQQLALAKSKADSESSGVDNFLRIGGENVKSLKDQIAGYQTNLKKAPSRKAKDDIVNEARNNTKSGFAQFETFVRNPALAKAFPGMTPEQIRSMYLAGIPEWVYNEGVAAPDVDFAGNYNWDRASGMLLKKRGELGNANIQNPEQWRRQEQSEYTQAINALGGGPEAIDAVVQNLGPLSGMGLQETAYYLKTGRVAPAAITREQANFQKRGGMNEVPIYDQQGNIADYGLASNAADPQLQQFAQDLRDRGVSEEDIAYSLGQMPGGSEYLLPEQIGRSAYDQMALDQVKTQQNANTIMDINDMIETGAFPNQAPIDPMAGAVNNVVPTGLSNAALLRPQRVQDAADMAALDRTLKGQKIEENRQQIPIRTQSLLNNEILQQWKIKGAPIEYATKKAKEVIERITSLNIEDKLAADLDLKLQQAFAARVQPAVAIENWRANADKVYRQDVGAAIGNLVKASQEFAIAPGFAQWVSKPGNSALFEKFKRGQATIGDLGPDAIGFANQAFAYEKARLNLNRAQEDLTLWQNETLPKTRSLLSSLVDTKFEKPKPAPAPAGKKGGKPGAKSQTSSKGGVGGKAPSIPPVK
jgi:hypothetical protein